MAIDFGRLTAEETMELATEALQALNEEHLFQVINDVLTRDQKAELGLSWEE